MLQRNAQKLLPSLVLVNKIITHVKPPFDMKDGFPLSRDAHILSANI